MSSQGKRGVATSVILILIIVIAVIAVGAWAMRSGSAAEELRAEVDAFEVREGSFDIIIPSSGELAALRQIEIKNMLEQRASIIEIIDEGVQAKHGDVLVRFNDEDIKTRIDDAEDSLDNAQNQFENAKANLEIRKKTRESELAKADLQITLTEIELQAWEEGEVVEQRQNLALEKKTAQMEYDRLEKRFEASQRLLEKEFISLDEFKRDEIEFVRADTRLKQAQLAIDIYEKYLYRQDREQKESDKQQAIDERDRIQQRYDAEVRSAESDLRSAENQVESRQERLDKWSSQLELCIITAPSDGLVVYATSLSSGGMHRGRDEDPPMVGTEVQPKKTIMVLPDISQMTAEVKVNEALSGLIERGQKATIVSDAHPELTLTGEVISVGVLAQTGGWRDPNRRDYTVNILLDEFDREIGLKPSMRAQANINVGRVSNAVYIPIQSVFRQGPFAFAWTPDGRGYSQREIKIGQASEMYVEVVEGLAPGDTVLMREPDAKEIVSTLDIPEGAPTLAGVNVAENVEGGEAQMPADHSGDTPRRGGMPGMDGQDGQGERGGMGGRGGGRGGGMGGMGGGRPSPEQMQEMMKNMTPEQREAMEKRIEEWRKRSGDGESGRGSDGGEESAAPETRG